MKPARQPRPDAIAMLAALNRAPADRAADPLPTTMAPRAVIAEPINVLKSPRRHKTGARAGTRLIGGHFPPATLKALKHLMAEEDCTLQALLDEAITDLLVKKGVSKLLDR